MKMVIHTLSQTWHELNSIPVFCAHADYDDCSLWGMCDQLCEDRIGSHRCSCREGYLLEQHRYCRANPSCRFIQASNIPVCRSCLVEYWNWFIDILFNSSLFASNSFTKMHVLLSVRDECQVKSPLFIKHLIQYSFKQLHSDTQENNDQWCKLWDKITFCCKAALKKTIVTFSHSIQFSSITVESSSQCVIDIR